MIDQEVMRSFLELSELERSATAELNSIKDRLEAVESVLVEMMITEGVRSVKLATGETVYLHRKSYPKMREGVQRGDVIAALRESGFGHMVEPNYNGNQLNALVSEFVKTGTLMPERLAGVLEVSERIEARLRRDASVSKEESVVKENMS